ncbi:MAG: VOC family protein [Bacilli bacterium]
MKVNVYLNFAGQTEEAFLFYKSVFGGEFSSFSRFGDTGHGDSLSESDKEKMMHVSLPLSDGYTLMGSDSLEAFGHSLATGNNFYISLHPDTESEATHIFERLSENGKVEMPLQRMFWGALYASFTDQFGIQWMINVDLNE